jgi:preprotein translocase subunit SecY
MYNSMNLAAFGRSGDLQSKILFVLFMLILYRVGTFIPLPGINTAVLAELNATHNSGVLGMFNMFAGGALGRMSIFALNIMPYITASIVMQLLAVIFDSIANLKKEGEAGRKKINQYTRYLTVALALSQGYGIVMGIEAMNTSKGPLVADKGILFQVVSVLSLTAGTILVMWMSEQINQKGIGNGSSLIIFTGIVSGLPGALATFFEMGRTGALSAPLMLFIMGVISAMIYVIVFFEKAQRRIVVNYPKRQVGNKLYGGDTTHMPLKLNTSGVLPAIFASSLLLFPATIAGFSQGIENAGTWQEIVALYLGHGKPLYIALYALLIAFFCFFYTSIIFNPDDTAENLRKNGGVVLGYRPGKHTAEYLDYVLTRITVIGAMYMTFVCVVPEVIMAQYSIPFYLGGTSVLILVNVVIDMFTQIQTYMLSSQYEALIKKSKFRGLN